jgi:hypothetical protein
MKENENCVRSYDNALDYQEIIAFVSGSKNALESIVHYGIRVFLEIIGSHLVAPFWCHQRNDFAHLSPNQIRRTLFLAHSVLFDWSLSALKWPQHPTVYLYVYTICIVSSQLMKSEVKESYQMISILVQRVGSTIDLVIFSHHFKPFSFLLCPSVQYGMISSANVSAICHNSIQLGNMGYFPAVFISPQGDFNSKIQQLDLSFISAFCISQVESMNNPVDSKGNY